MSVLPDGGFAFPTPNSGEWGFNSKNEKIFCPDVTPGMTLRDWFAGMALQGFCANPNIITQSGAFKHANFATIYDFADAMIEERQRREKP